MPESDFSKLNPAAGIDRVGGATDRSSIIDPSISVKHDQTLHLPLAWHVGGPGILPAPPPQAPPPPAPDEAQRRSELKAALSTQVTAQATLEAAQGTHSRARAHARTCRETLEAFGNLNAAMRADLLEQLRAGDRDIESSRELRQRSQERGQAEQDYVVAAEAEHACGVELTQTTSAAQAADIAVRQALVHVIAFHAVRLTEQREAVLAEAQALLELLVGFDHWSTPSRVTAPQVVLKALRESGADLGRRVDLGVWIALGERLIVDPDTPFEEAT